MPVSDAPHHGEITDDSIAKMNAQLKSMPCVDVKAVDTFTDIMKKLRTGSAKKDKIEGMVSGILSFKFR